MQRATFIFMSFSVSSNQRICLVCVRQISKYVCPKCQAPYCSIPCYKNHDSKCTERFYEQNVKELLASKYDSTNGRKSMVDILKRNAGILSSQEIDNEAEIDDSEINLKFDQMMEKFREMVMQDKIKFEDLPVEIKTEIMRLALNGSLSQHLSVRDVWWKNPAAVDDEPLKYLVEEVGVEDPFLLSANCELKIPKLDSIFKGTPSPLLRFNLIEFLYFYAYIYICFENGAAFNDDSLLVLEAAICLVDACKSFRGKIFESLEETLHLCFEYSRIFELKRSNEFSVSVCKHVTQILYHKKSVLHALDHLEKLVLSKAKKAAKKIEFFLSWAQEQDDCEFVLLGDQVKQFYMERLAASREENQNIKV